MGAVLWEGFSGELLFDEESDLDVFRQVRACEVKPLQECRPDIPEALVAVIHRALSAEPTERYSSAREMASEIAQILKHSGTQDAHNLLGKNAIEARKRFQPYPY